MSDGVVATRYGSVRGVESDGVWAFRGIRYAASPSGQHRFSPPRRPESWRGVRPAAEPGPIAPQPLAGITGGSVPGDAVDYDEDCLFLNVVTPALDDGRRPVLCFVHGGAFVTGSGSQAMYAGEELARGGAVVVTVNYRLGALGFLAHPALALPGAGCGNWGLADLVAALGWVRENVSAFGGDPGRVTLFGESAGAMAIADLLGAPAANGLFRRAVLESGATSAIELEVAAATAAHLGAELGLRTLTREALSSVPVTELLAAQTRIVAETDAGFGLPFRPVVDGGLLHEHPAAAIAAGRGPAVDLLVGTNRDEFRFFSVATGTLDPDGPTVESLIARYLEAAHLRRPLTATAVLDRYRSARARRREPTSWRDLLDAVAGDWIFRVPQLRLASAHARRHRATYAYLFDWASPFGNGALGACHGLELPFVFGTWRDPVIGLFAGGGPEAERLSETMRAAWIAFARDGDPSTPALGSWPAYDVATRATMRLGAHCHLEEAPYEEERAFWETPLGRFGVDGAIEHGRYRGVALLAPTAEERAGT